MWSLDQILLLDEATSSVDLMTDQLIQVRHCCDMITDLSFINNVACKPHHIRFRAIQTKISLSVVTSRKPFFRSKQETIRTEFTNCTIITIAHRIATIMDNDRFESRDGVVSWARENTPQIPPCRVTSRFTPVLIPGHRICCVVRIVVLQDGRVLAVDTPQELERQGHL